MKNSFEKHPTNPHRLSYSKKLRMETSLPIYQTVSVTPEKHPSKKLFSKDITEQISRILKQQKDHSFYDIVHAPTHALPTFHDIVCGHFI